MRLAVLCSKCEHCVVTTSVVVEVQVDVAGSVASVPREFTIVATDGGTIGVAQAVVKVVEAIIVLIAR